VTHTLPQLFPTSCWQGLWDDSELTHPQAPHLSTEEEEDVYELNLGLSNVSCSNLDYLKLTTFFGFLFTASVNSIPGFAVCSRALFGGQCTLSKLTKIQVSPHITFTSHNDIPDPSAAAPCRSLIISGSSVAWCVFPFLAFFECTELLMEGTMGVIVEGTIEVAVGGAVEAVMEGAAGAISAVVF
jgi:hypothetical protein